MAATPATRLVETALRCYPARWRTRHGDEAAELAKLLIGDGTPASSVACSYLAGAAREWLTPRPSRHLSAVARQWLTPRPSRRLSAVAGALLIVACSLGVSAGLLASAGPARAASTSQARGTSASQTHEASTSHHQASAGAPDGPTAPEPVPGVIPRGHPQTMIIWAGHVSSG